MDRAALTIQRHYRGYRTRKNLPPEAQVFQRARGTQQYLGMGGAAPAAHATGFQGPTPDQNMMNRVRFQEGTYLEPRRVRSWISHKDKGYQLRTAVYRSCTTS